MKKNYFFLLALLALCTANLNAQTTLIDLSESSYDSANTAGIDSDLGVHPHWDTNGNWSSSFTTTTITGNSNWKRAVYQTAITATDGQYISAKARIKLGNNDQDFLNAENFLLMAFSIHKDAATGPATTDREGVVIQSSTVGDNEVRLNGGGAANFSNKPKVSMADKNTYEVTFELHVGADAASSSIKAKITNVGSNETSLVEQSAMGINQSVYDAVKGSGVYLLFYSYNPFQGSGSGVDYNINYVGLVNQIEFTVSSSEVLSTKKFNSFEFSTFPNPVKNNLYISSKETINNAEIFNLLGKRVLSSNNITSYLDVSSLSKSIYILKLTSDKGVSTSRFVKQ